MADAKVLLERRRLYDEGLADTAIACRQAETLFTRFSTDRRSRLRPSLVIALNADVTLNISQIGHPPTRHRWRIDHGHA